MDSDEGRVRFIRLSGSILSNFFITNRHQNIQKFLISFTKYRTLRSGNGVQTILATHIHISHRLVKLSEVGPELRLLWFSYHHILLVRGSLRDLL